MFYADDCDCDAVTLIFSPGQCSYVVIIWADVNLFNVANVKLSSVGKG